MTYQALRPNWYYSYVDIPNLEEIKEELRILPDIVGKRYYKDYFSVVDGVPGLTKSPKLFKFLMTLGIASRVQYILFKTPMDKPEIHVDSFDPTLCQMSLNIPIDDYENTYTCWYDIKEYEFDVRVGAAGATSKGKSYAVCIADNPKEIKRVETVKPMLINTTIFHGVDAGASTNRYVCCIRFDMPLPDSICKKLGIQEPYVQTD